MADAVPTGSLVTIREDLQQAAVSLLEPPGGEQAEFERGIAVARTISDSLIPSNDVVSYQGLELAGLHRSASICGGDWWTSYDLGDNRTLVVIADVTGHGLAAAMIMATAKGCCDALKATLASSEIQPGRLLHILNESLHEIRASMTCFAAIIDTSRGRILFSNGGHVFPYLLRRLTNRVANGADETGRAHYDLQCLGDASNVLGISPDAEFHEEERALEPGDVILWYTDGLIECADQRRRVFGRARLRRSMETHAGLGTATAIRDAVAHDALKFAGDVPLDDDLMVVVGTLPSSGR
jgi:sigma-B regulation protein RsbU (phosphoserine phosphatase)